MSDSCKTLVRVPLGPTGPQGKDGKDGTDGIDGANGSSLRVEDYSGGARIYDDFGNCATVLNGVDGAAGSNGADGADGAPAATILTITGSNPTDPSFYNGSPAGTLVFRSDTGDVWRWTGTSLDSLGSLEGPVGATGAQGPAGADGVIGTPVTDLFNANTPIGTDQTTVSLSSTPNLVKGHMTVYRGRESTVIGLLPESDGGGGDNWILGPTTTLTFTDTINDSTLGITDEVIMVTYWV